MHLKFKFDFSLFLFQLKLSEHNQKLQKLTFKISVCDLAYIFNKNHQTNYFDTY